MSVFKGIKELFRGMGITTKHLGRRAITIQYPEEKFTMPERSRGIVVLLSDKETGELNCTSCMLCMRACPSAAIIIDAPRDEKKKRHLKSFDIDFGLCCFCGLCEEACNFSAIKMATKYEFSTIDASDLYWDVKKLQEMGRDVDYIDTRKKKTVKPEPTGDSKPAVAAAPAESTPVENPVSMESPSKEATEMNPETASGTEPQREVPQHEESPREEPPQDKEGKE
jgi:NADH-quinone oxidoreductase subunit I